MKTLDYKNETVEVSVNCQTVQRLTDRIEDDIESFDDNCTCFNLQMIEGLTCSTDEEIESLDGIGEVYRASSTEFTTPRTRKDAPRQLGKAKLDSGAKSNDGVQVMDVCDSVEQILNVRVEVRIQKEKPTMRSNTAQNVMFDASPMPTTAAQNHGHMIKTPINNPYAKKSVIKNTPTNIIGSSSKASIKTEPCVVPSPLRNDNNLFHSPAYVKCIENPYRKREGDAIPNNSQSNSKVKRIGLQEAVIPRKFKSFDTFFAILLRSSATDYITSEDEESSMNVWQTLCDRASLKIIERSIEPFYMDPKEHFAVRAALVLEEAREALSRPLAERWAKRRKRKLFVSCPSPLMFSEPEHSKIISIHVHITDVERRDNNLFVISFRSKKKFTTEALGSLRQGTIIECLRNDPLYYNENSVLLGCVLPCEKKELIKKASFNMVMFRELPEFVTKYSSWILHPVDNFIPLMRQFSAMTDQQPEHVCFIRALQGLSFVEMNNKTEEIDTQPISTKDSSDNVVQEFPEQAQHNGPVPMERKSFPLDFCSREEHFLPSLETLKQRLPLLNSTQQVAVDSFINSARETITIIQGPPGTGQKEQSASNDRVLVSAPTNKAITVLAARFIKTTKKFPINTVLVGDAEKLLVSDEISSLLRPYFVYSFQDLITEQLGALVKSIDQSDSDQATLHKNAIALKEVITRRLKGLDDGFKTKLETLCSELSEESVDTTILLNHAKAVFVEFSDFPSEILMADLLDSANVIFSTLCSSGSTLMKKTALIHALIIDEAAAATEPELCVPFHLRPDRLLIVGDPKQLPSTVLSARAQRLGLSTSLHERLMYSCKSKYIMLDSQYRMHPEISLFPSRRFYESKIKDAMKETDCTQQKRGLLFNGQPYLFLRTKGTEMKGFGGSSQNRTEAEVIRNLLQQLVNPNDKGWSSPDRVRIITFYSAQVTFIQTLLARHKMESVLVSTVDSSQGCEADIIILSLVRTESAGFLTDDRRLNVALTRARRQLVCVGNIESLARMECAPTLLHLAADAQDRNLIFDSVM